MPRAVEKPSTYIWASEALALLTPAYGGIDVADRVLLRALKAKQIPWTFEDVDPPGTPIDGLWQKGSLKPRLAQNEATFKEVFALPGDAFAGGFHTITVSGIKFELAAVEALLPAGYVASVKSKRDWLDGAKVQFPRNGRSNESWAKALRTEMVKEHNAGKVEGVYAESSLQRELESPRK